MVDKIITQSKLESEGVYTSIGTYKFSEMLQLLQNLSTNTGFSIDNLCRTLFSVLEQSYPRLLARYKDSIEMLASIENHIYVEVKKNQDAELPTFIVEEKTKNSLAMIYNSRKAMHHFGLGLMNKTFEYFNSSAEIILEKNKIRRYRSTIYYY